MTCCLRYLGIVCMLATIVSATPATSAESRYKIHPTDGEFAKTSNPCGAQTQDELYSRVLKFVPILIIRPVETPGGKGAMTLNIAGDDHPDDETMNGEGRWYYNSVNKQQLKTQKIVLRPGNKDKPQQRVISISVIRRMDEIECSERWVGIVEVSNGN